MSIEQLKQEVEGNVPPWQRVLDSVQHIGQNLQASAETFGSGYTAGGTDLARNLGNMAAEKLIPGTGAQPEQATQPVGDFGQLMTAGAGIAGALKNPLMEGIGKIPGMLEVKKVESIQKAFPPWVKKHTESFGKVVRGGLKNAIKQSNPKEIKRIFNPFYRNQQAYDELGAQAKQAIDAVRNNPTPRAGLRAYQKIKKDIPQSQLSGRMPTEKGRAGRETIKKVKDYAKSKIPGLKKEAEGYAKFSKQKKVMEQFEPQNVGASAEGTVKGTRFLRNIRDKQPGEIEALKAFGKETKIPIVGPAKAAALGRAVIKKAGDALPYALGIGGSSWYLGRKMSNMGGGNPPQP